MYKKDKETLALEAEANARKKALDSYVSDSRLTTMRDNVLNRKKFNYDPTTDPLYLQMRDSYARQGKMAMTDTMSKAASLTGGYGNSYATAAGQQMYNKYMQDFNDIVPTLADRARSNYDADTAAMYQQYGLLADEDAQQRAQLRDDYATALNNYVNQRNFGYQAYKDDEAMAYQRERDAIADKRYEDETAYARQQDAINNYLKASGGSGGNSTPSYKTLSSSDQAKLDKYAEKGDAKGVATLLENAGLSPEDTEKYMKQYGGFGYITADKLSNKEVVSGEKALAKSDMDFIKWAEKMSEDNGYDMDSLIDYFDKLQTMKAKSNGTSNVRDYLSKSSQISSLVNSRSTYNKTTK